MQCHINKGRIRPLVGTRGGRAGQRRVVKWEVGSEDHFSQEVFAGSRFWFDLEIPPEAGAASRGAWTARTNWGWTLLGRPDGAVTKQHGVGGTGVAKGQAVVNPGARWSLEPLKARVSRNQKTALPTIFPCFMLAKPLVRAAPIRCQLAVWAQWGPPRAASPWEGC